MRFAPVVLSLALVIPSAALSQSAALRIVVLEGEGGVNIIQQKTAVRPLVEVRDRNNLPVAGASVTFSIAGGGQTAAFAGGVQTLAVTTNAAGQAAAGGLNAISSGAFQIQVSAAYQGQIATAAISQTNFATAAAAAQAGASTSGASGGGAGGSGTSGAAGGGGGMSAATIGIVGAAVAGGGAVAATQLGGKGDQQGPSIPIQTFSGSISSSMAISVTTGATTCVYTVAIAGPMTIKIAQPGDKDTTHTEIQATQTETGRSGGALCNTQPFNAPFSWNIPITGPESALEFSQSTTNTSTGIATVTSTNAIQFRGALNGNVITGTLAYTTSQSGTGSGGSPITGSGSATFAVTLQKQ